MSFSGQPSSSQLATADLHNIWLRGRNLTEEIMGHHSFADVSFLLLAGRFPDDAERRIIDSVFVALMEHGLTPSAVVTRLTYSVAPDSLQGAVSAGLIGVAGNVLGSMEECAKLLEQIVAREGRGENRLDITREIATAYRRNRQRIPGLGHSIHTEGDPRAERLLAIAAEEGKSGQYVEALRSLVDAARNAAGKDFPLNVTGAVGAVLLELNIPWRLHRGFALISRCVGLVAHVGEEMEHPIGPEFRRMARGL